MDYILSGCQVYSDSTARTFMQTVREIHNEATAMTCDTITGRNPSFSQQVIEKEP